MTFAELGLAEPILKAIHAEGYDTPTPIQERAAPEILAGKDILGCAQTGTGKTAAFALPILHMVSTTGRQPKGQRRKVRVLVIAPTRELAQQIADSFRVYGKNTGLSVVEVYGGVNQKKQVQAFRDGVEILVATPGRLLDLHEQGVIDLKHIEFFVLDEADRMLDMGFMPDVRKIAALLPTRRQTLLFSATMPREIVHLANELLTDPAEVEVAPEKVTADLITQSVYFVHKKHKPVLLAHLISSKALTRVLVFCRTKFGADICVKSLHRAGIKAEAIHGDKSQSMRMKALANFKTGRAHVLAATDVAARGIDVDGISHVINYDVPFDPESYVHRIGRTGRAGASGEAISFCTNEERPMLKRIERLIRMKLNLLTDHPEYPDLPPEAKVSPEDTSDSEASPASPSQRRPPRKFGAPRGGKPAGGAGGKFPYGQRGRSSTGSHSPAAASTVSTGTAEGAAAAGSSTASAGARNYGPRGGAGAGRLGGRSTSGHAATTGHGGTGGSGGAPKKGSRLRSRRNRGRSES